MAQIESTQWRNQHEGKSKGRRHRISHQDVEENLRKKLSVFTIMTMESRTLLIVRLSHDIACVQMNRLEPESLFLSMTGASDFYSQGGAIFWAGRRVRLRFDPYSDLPTIRT